MARQDYARAALEFQNATQLNPSDAEPYYQLGLAYIGSRQLHLAFDALTRASRLNPSHAFAQVKLAELTAATGNEQMIESARSSMQELLRQSPPSADALDALAMTQFRLGNWQDARQALSQALEQFPDHLKSSAALAKFEVTQGHIAKAEEILRKAAAQSPQSPEARLLLADFYLSTRRAANAAEHFRGVLQLQPQNVVALLGLAAAQVESGDLAGAEQTYRNVSSIPKYEHVYPSYLVAQGRYSEAVSRFEQLEKADSQDGQARNRLVVACILANQSPKAERILARSLQVRPKDTDALILSAVILLNTGKFKDAEQKLLQALTFKPDSDVVHSLLSRVHRACGRMLPQRQELTEALRINPNLLQARLELAENLMLGSATKSALGVLDAAPDQQKDTLTWIIHRNWALLDLGDQAALRKGIEAGLARGRSPDLLLQSGLLKMRAKDYPGAHAALEEGLQRSPEDPRLLWAIAQTHVLEGRATLASKSLQDHGNKWPHSPRVQLLVGEWLSRTGDLAGARRAFLAAKGADPHSVEADFQLARLDANEGKMDEARRRFVALAEQPGYQLSAQVWLASIADRAQNHAEAAEGYRRVLAMNPQNLIALNNLAYLLATHTDQLDEALQNAQRARELAPANADVEGTLGWVLYRKGMYDSALRYLKEASRNDGVTTSESAAIRKYHLGMAYLKTGDRELGLRTLASALQINSKLPEAETARLLLRTGEVH